MQALVARIKKKSRDLLCNNAFKQFNVIFCERPGWVEKKNFFFHEQNIYWITGMEYFISFNVIS